MISRDSGALRTEGAVEELDASMGGKWIVQTQGTLHLFNLDDWTYERRQQDGLNPMRRDYESVPLSADCIMRWPKVDDMFRIFIEVDSYGTYLGSVRTSSLIRSITPATEEET